MPDSKPQKIVYLFGAGATHAEMERMYEGLVTSDTEKDRIGLLMGNLSRRVLKQAQNEEIFEDILDTVTTPDGAENIELFIALLENNSTDINIKKAAEKVNRLRELVEKDIEKVLFRQRRLRFLLHRAFFELHHKTSFKMHEKIIGVLSLNYDVVLDEAYSDIYGYDPDYAFSLSGKIKSGKQIPLLKLHGSLGWDKVCFLGKKYQKIPIMPLGINKDYLQWPYNYIWGRAFELLIDCDVLRVVGCSLSPNDTKLVDLLFKSHITRQRPFFIDIINRQKAGKMFKSNYDFLPKIRLPEDIESNLGFGGISKKEDSPFRGWLKGLGDQLPKKELEATKHLKFI